MQKTKLIQLLGSLSQQETKEFRDFCRSPFFNKNANLSKLYDVLLKHHPDYGSKTLTEEKVFQKVFPGDKHDYSKFRNLMSDLFQLGMEFLKIKGSRQYQFVDELRLLFELRTRNLMGLFEKRVALAVKNLESMPESEEILYNSFMLQGEVVNLAIIKKPITHIAPAEKQLELFLKFVLLRLLKFYNIQLHERKQSHFDYKFLMMNEVLGFLKENPDIETPLISLYRKMLQLELFKDETSFFELKEFYLKNQDKLDAYDVFLAMIILNGFCAYNYNSLGDRKYIPEAYEFSRGAYLAGRVILGKLLYPDFVNYVKIFVRNGDIELAEKFIEEYKDRLPKDEKENSLNFSYSMISYVKGEYNDALKYASMVNFSSFLMKVQARLLHIQILYSSGLPEQMRSTIDSFKRFVLKERSLTDEYREAMQNFLKLTINLMKINEESDKRSKEDLIDQLNVNIRSMNANPFGIKIWLEDQLQLIQKSNC